MPSFTSIHTSTADITPAIRHALAYIPPAHLDALVSLALEATQHDPSIDFLTAVKALWRCNAHNPNLYPVMSDEPRDPDPTSTPNTHSEVPHAQLVAQQPQTRPAPHNQDIDMPDAPSSTSPQRAACQSNKPVPSVTLTLKVTIDPQQQQQHREVVYAAMRDRTCTGVSWQRREQLALAHAYLQAFQWWPHAKSSERQCEGFLMKYCNH
ncbi:uncharacterized protein N0V89_008961 [Didymosphaeria variabile]|uniref:Uncharacterized protein n=1 Tax=Didymosphaeria variabile TaxID=1932322 RepID=A0A9W8XGX7_9PLEO|nr:uncharacterized protein N0V89_008961 [Didymosphaeria variabile]KAJ4350340.1 hypothetical protein N0V89_008961 [Didymosphaeria variabile]